MMWINVEAFVVPSISKLDNTPRVAADFVDKNLMQQNLIVFEKIMMHR
jgi:hypothetical protein